MMCPLSTTLWMFMVLVGWKILFIAWIIILPVMVISRLNKIIKILEEKNK
ncbi:MAG TPA: hypothetical protein PLH56_01900 [Candidatus Omnitrophota bacterium]|nr:hypothetical protein [Candidatus Omnitrophota bacterium]HPN88071.1 hypothetical protein [Candidatus Omnitrophota bacterium]